MVHDHLTSDENMQVSSDSTAAFANFSIDDPTKRQLNGIRYGYLTLVCLIFLLGCINFGYFLIVKGKWTTLPLLLLYISGQLTMIFAIARTAYPYQPMISDRFTKLEVNVYLENFAFTAMQCTGVSQLATLIELLMKTYSISAFMQQLQDKSQLSVIVSGDLTGDSPERSHQRVLLSEANNENYDMDASIIISPELM